MQETKNQERLVKQLQAATAQVETIRKLYQNKEDPLKLAEHLHAVIGVLQEIQREVVSKELTTVLNNEALAAATRKAQGAKLFQLLAKATSGGH